jgi:RsiW-degrading membrane proteinase PrsW (M82 family)
VSKEIVADDEFALGGIMMTFSILFMYAYGLFQLYILAFCKTLRASTLVFLFCVGVLSCISLTIVLQAIAVHYLDRTSLSSALLAAIEELAKAAPIAFFLFRTRVSQFAGLASDLGGTVNCSLSNMKL